MRTTVWVRSFSHMGSRQRFISSNKDTRDQGEWDLVSVRVSIHLVSAYLEDPQVGGYKAWQQWLSRRSGDRENTGETQEACKNWQINWKKLAGWAVNNLAVSRWRSSVLYSWWLVVRNGCVCSPPPYTPLHKEKHTRAGSWGTETGFGDRVAFYCSAKQYNFTVRKQGRETGLVIMTHTRTVKMRRILRERESHTLLTC